ncbi:hypothetical protein [Dactylosporangium sp. NPDC050588]|uniref:hypothetical protein n=1 Tax=Dactylosporangium sp. NPDC050588 TaxID=3157211 RepID=UPI0033E61122
MTHYAVDETHGKLIAVWSVGHGETARVVASLPAAAVAPEQSFALAVTLTGLSQVLWRCYTHPASATSSHEVDSEGWRRAESRKSFELVVSSLRNPNLPDGDTLLTSYDPVEESAHRIGRALHAIGDADLSNAITDDVQSEIAAVEDAERGDLNGRARQAVMLSRADASPVQVAAADHLLRQNPLGSDDLFLTMDPTAASVAAAHWLRAAADVVADLSGIDPTSVVEEADNIEALPHATPTKVLEMLDLGLSPRNVVIELITDAMRVAEGEMPDLDEARDAIDDAEQLADHDADGAEVMPVRLTPFDPQRPARDLLEDLLAGIRGCWLLYTEHYILSTERADDASDEYRDDEIDTSFIQAVRKRASEDRKRLE